MGSKNTTQTPLRTRLKNICRCGILAILILAFGCASTKSVRPESIIKEFGSPEQIFIEEGTIFRYWSDVSMRQIKNRFGEPEIAVNNGKFNLYIFDNGLVFSDSNEAKGVIYITALK